MMRKSLLLNGFMATGKSTVGRLIAQRGGAPFVDLDREIEQQAGQSVAALFAARGETGFRRLEAEALDRILEESTAPVVALGGGALLARERRLKALDSAVVVTLTADVQELIERASTQPGSRPLLEGENASERIVSLLELRQVAYGECHARVDTTAKKPNEVAREVFEIWERDPVAVAAGQGSYRVETGTGIAAERVGECVRGASGVVLVSDSNVAPLHAGAVQEALSAEARTELVVMPAGEAHKTLDTVQKIWERARSFGADRSTLFVGLGGGVVTDVTGYVAACWMRGVDWVGVPTTLLSMVDASVGGKTGVDLGPAKNCVGAFWQPKRVYCDVGLAATEPERGVTALSEVVKTALIGDPALLGLLERNPEAARSRDPDFQQEMVRRCVVVKAKVVGQDTREAGVRAALNLGHTLGHALEAVHGFERLTHGEAVSLGLVAALRIGNRLGVTGFDLVQRVTSLLERLGLPTDLSKEPLVEAVKLLALDKKRKGSQVRFVVLADVGRVQFQPIELAELELLGVGLAPAASPIA